MSQYNIIASMSDSTVVAEYEPQKSRSEAYQSEAQLEALADELCGTACACTKTEQKTTFSCNVCGYVYQGDTLPEDFVCPICKRGAKDFTKNA